MIHPFPAPPIGVISPPGRLKRGFFLDESLSGDITIFVIISPEMEITENEENRGREDDKQARKHDIPRDGEGFMDLLILDGADPSCIEKDPEDRPEEVDDKIEDLKAAVK